jgi:16S rRNA (cytidine1402-2'-O)-methyltransferase
MIFFEAPHRVAATVQAMAAAFGDDRPAALCRELTKTYEEVRRGRLGTLAQWAAGGVRGEITLVVAGADPSVAVADPTGWAAAVAELCATGMIRRDAVAEVAARTGAPRREVYAASLAT